MTRIVTLTLNYDLGFVARSVAGRGSGSSAVTRSGTARVRIEDVREWHARLPIRKTDVMVSLRRRRRTDYVIVTESKRWRTR